MILEKGISRILSVVAGKASHHPMLENPALATVQGKTCLVATDGKAMVAVPVERSEGDTLGSIPCDALKAFDKARPNYPVEVSANGKVAFEIAGQSQAFARPDFDSPDFDHVIPQPADSDILLGINPEMLASLAKAMGFCAKGGDRLILRLRLDEEGKVNSAIRVECWSNPDTIGVIMPILAD